MVKRTHGKTNIKIKTSKLSQYDKIKVQYLKGKITDDEWDTFCMECLDELLRDNAETLKKLKNI